MKRLLKILNQKRKTMADCVKLIRMADKFYALEIYNFSTYIYFGWSIIMSIKIIDWTDFSITIYS